MFLPKLKSALAVLLIVGLFTGGILSMTSDGSRQIDKKPEKSWASKVLTEQFPQTHKLIRPQPGESRWREVPWLTSLWEARQKAAAAGKPIVVFTGSGGAPLCQT
jgi:hypothetical protein